MLQPVGNGPVLDPGNRVQAVGPAVTTYYAWDAHNRLSAAEPVGGGR
ncbi:hypothetical protein [Fimbriiglobus ruber]|uniref:Uncharacterized protein n=1 Tax=Fimbriiglobus ruber TaxID=1908690 RepID=A0A225DTE3_9BACT|nr:hypothetical protein [Fimbriiglobus ruber]OWK39387.1 hypothetical protein FRUB_05950 [Fimbriiglobus ruber]